MDMGAARGDFAISVGTRAAYKSWSAHDGEYYYPNSSGTFSGDVIAYSQKINALFAAVDFSMMIGSIKIFSGADWFFDMQIETLDKHLLRKPVLYFKDVMDGGIGLMFDAGLLFQPKSLGPFGLLAGFHYEYISTNKGMSFKKTASQPDSAYLKDVSVHSKAEINLFTIMLGLQFSLMR
jgi:outer membrane protease